MKRSAGIVALVALVALARAALADPVPVPDAGPPREVRQPAPVSTAPAGDAADATATLGDPGDLESSAQDDELAASASRVRIYGFADMTIRRAWLGSDDSVYRLYSVPEAGFAMGRINVYLRADPAPRFTSLIEVRLLYLPNGVAEIGRDGSVTTTSTHVFDDADIGGTLDWGGISIQRAQLDYQLTDRLTIRLGHWLTPWGIWNVDHGSPVIIAVRRPHIIASSPLPESQIGAQIFGTLPIGKAELTWAATLSNGTAGINAVLDDDLDKAVGGRAELRLPALDELRVGGSAYLGFEHVSTFRATASDPANPATAVLERTVQSSMIRLVLGADFRLRWGRLHLLGEGLVAQKRFGDRRPPAEVPRLSGFEPDHLVLGYYLVGGIQTDLLHAMPYVQHEQTAGTDFNTTARITSIGINVRPVPTVALKLDVGMGRLAPWGDSPLLPRANLFLVEAQVAWVFR